MITDNQSIRQRCFARYLLLNKRTQTALTNYLAQFKAQKGQKAFDDLQTFIDAEKASFRGWCSLQGVQPIWRNFCYYYVKTLPVKEGLQWKI